ncbi:MAG: helix-turn-helix domain-containing protein [Erysipelotrichaceae bacterium]
MTFGEKLAIARKEKNLSQEDLAQKLYVTRQAISRWENNTAQPSLEMLSALCRELGNTPNDLIETEGENPPRFYKSLSFKEKYCLNLEWQGEHKLLLFLRWLSSLVFLFGFGATLFFIISNPYQNYSPALFASCLSGAILLFLVGIFLFVLNLINSSIKFNAWLLQKKCIIRKRK